MRLNSQTVAARPRSDEPHEPHARSLITSARRPYAQSYCRVLRGRCFLRARYPCIAPVFLPSPTLQQRGPSLTRNSALLGGTPRGASETPLGTPKGTPKAPGVFETSARSGRGAESGSALPPPPTAPAPRARFSPDIRPHSPLRRLDKPLAKINRQRSGTVSTNTGLCRGT